MDCDIAPVLAEGTSFTIARNSQPGRVAGVEAYAIDREAAERLWTMSETMTGVHMSA